MSSSKKSDKPSADEIPTLACVSKKCLGDETLSNWIEDENLYIGGETPVEGSFDSKWENPFIKKDNPQEAYEKYARKTPDIWDNLIELRGKRLGCFAMSADRHHGTVLIKLFCEKFKLPCPSDHDLLKQIDKDAKMKIEIDITIKVNGMVIKDENLGLEIAERFFTRNMRGGRGGGSRGGGSRGGRGGRSQSRGRSRNRDDSDDEDIKPRSKKTTSSKPEKKDEKKKPKIKKVDSDDE